MQAVCVNTGFKIEGRPEPPPGQGPSTDVRVADAGYFPTMGIPLLRGRSFSDMELREARQVILINEALITAGGRLLLACYLPARRAMRIDPLQALRYE